MKKITAISLTFVLILGLFLTSCGEKADMAGEFVLAAEPAPELLSEAEGLLSDFITCYENKDAAGAVSLFASEVEATEESLAEYFETVHEYSDAPYVPGDIYYIKNLPDTAGNVKVKKSAEDENYIEFTPIDGEFFYAYYTADSELESRMMTFILLKEGDKLKIQHTNPAVYEFNGKDANAYFEETKRLSDEGKTVAACISSCMLGTVLRPGGHYRYANDTEMEDLCYQMYLGITDKFALPLALSDTTNASLGQVDFIFDDTYGAIPRLLFKTDVPITDKAALTAEANKVVDALEKLSPGLRESFDYLRADATNDELGENADSIKSDYVIIPLKK